MSADWSCNISNPLRPNLNQPGTREGYAGHTKFLLTEVGESFVKFW